MVLLINIFARSFFFVPFLISLDRFSYFNISQNFSRQSPKNSNRNLKRFIFSTEKILFSYKFFFSICCIVPLFYTEKGNYFSLTRFALRFSDFFLIYFCIMHTCNHVLYVCVSKCLFSFIHNREKGFLSTNDDVLSLVSSLKLLSQCLH